MPLHLAQPFLAALISNPIFLQELATSLLLFDSTPQMLLRDLGNAGITIFILQMRNFGLKPQDQAHLMTCTVFYSAFLDPKFSQLSPYFYCLCVAFE